MAIIVMKPKNITAKLITYKAKGNPPSSIPDSAISNCFPGLEFDLKNLLRRLISGIELHESISFIVMDVEADSEAFNSGVRGINETTRGVFRLSKIDNILLRGATDNPTRSQMIEGFNAFAEIFSMAGKTLLCEFEEFEFNSGNVLNTISANLMVNSIFENSVIKEQIAAPGELTQSLCSPWQADYRECGCHYWAASRPDYVNIDTTGTETKGINWLQKNRDNNTGYISTMENEDFISYDELYSAWEQHLKFIIKGQDVNDPS